MRPIKFRAWDGVENKMWSGVVKEGQDPGDSRARGVNGMIEWAQSNGFILMQFTGLIDKNSITEIYEGDMIDVEGDTIGNIYESPQIHKEGTYFVIEGMGTSAWRNTESIAMGFGLKYAQ